MTMRLRISRPRALGVSQWHCQSLLCRGSDKTNNRLIDNNQTDVGDRPMEKCRRSYPYDLERVESYPYDEEDAMIVSLRSNSQN
jgi:hypothetical protein